jgi:hypothetical protein
MASAVLPVPGWPASRMVRQAIFPLANELEDEAGGAASQELPHHALRGVASLEGVQTQPLDDRELPVSHPIRSLPLVSRRESPSCCLFPSSVAPFGHPFAALAPVRRRRVLATTSVASSSVHVLEEGGERKGFILL